MNSGKEYSMLQKLNSSSNNETSSYVLSTTVMKAFHILEFISAHQPVQPAISLCSPLTSAEDWT